jgi:hypothetical protein
MGVIARTSNTGVSTGPLGLFVLAIGGLIALVLAALVVAVTFIAAGVMLGVGEVRRHGAARLVR